MKLLVTGGAGYIGSIVADRLVRAGHEVVVLDNLSRGHGEAIPTACHHEQVDLLDPTRLSQVIGEGDFDGVLHFAALALVAESVSNPELYYRNNLIGTFNLLDAMRRADVKRLVFSSTCAVYGEPDKIPISEAVPTKPVNAYGNSKLAVDQMISDESAAHELGAISLRYFNVAGASGEFGEDHEPETHLIPLVLQAAAGQRTHVSIYGTDYPTPDGTAIRDYIHIEDLSDAHVLAIEQVKNSEHQIYNLGNGSGFSVREVIDVARKVTEREIVTVEESRRMGDPSILVAASEKIRSELGWAPKKPQLEQMISDAWQWFQANPNGYSSDNVETG